MTGRHIRNYLIFKQEAAKTKEEKKLFSFTEIAKKLKISDQNFGKKLKSRDLGTLVVKEIAEAVGVTVKEIEEFTMPGTETNNTVSEPNQTYTSMDYREKYIKALEENNTLYGEHTRALKDIIFTQKQLLECQNSRMKLESEIARLSLKANS